MDPESLVRGGPNFSTFFYVYFSVAEGREDPKNTLRHFAVPMMDKH